MSGRRIREWPRLVTAVSVLAVLLVAIGVLVASAASGSTTPRPRIVAARSPSVSRVALSSDAAQIARLRTELGTQATQLRQLRSELGRARAGAGCWERKARHPRKTRALRCPTS